MLQSFKNRTIIYFVLRGLASSVSLCFIRQVDEYKVTSPRPLGSLLLVRLEKQRYWVEDNWFCRYVTVEPPGGDKAVFPCYRWLTGDIKVDLRAGTGRRIPGIHRIIS